MAHIQTVMLPKPWLVMQLLTVQELVKTDTETICQHHLYLVDRSAENGLRHLSTKQGVAFPREPATVIEAEG
ncbi:hypothetical protein [Devosia sp.]|uniref:hypothetical protein n=1 Tax=Devosia sp. TaxID=1871048 RepID=UPI002AFE1A92|nr:hypothetical protein [Devosia sp.]